MKCFEKPLSVREEKEMIDRYRSGDAQAKNILIEKNMRLVAHMTKKYVSPERDQDDLISVGTIGLIKAVNSYNPDKGIRFATYAAKCIDNELLMMLRAEKKKAKEISIYEPVGTDKEGNEISILEIISEEDVDIVEDYLFQQRVSCLRKNMKNILNERELEIILKRYGLGGEKEKTQFELAGEMGISRSYVSRIEKRALDKLKILLENNNL